MLLQKSQSLQMTASWMFTAHVSSHICQGPPGVRREGQVSTKKGGRVGGYGAVSKGKGDAGGPVLWEVCAADLDAGILVDLIPACAPLLLPLELQQYGLGAALREALERKQDREW